MTDSDEAITGAERSALQRGERFEWRPETPATELDILSCEELLGFALSPSHRALLRRCNGATFLYWLERQQFNEGLRFLSIADMLSNRDRLRLIYDAEPPPFEVSPERWKWGGLIPVFDLENAQFFVCEPIRREGDEYVVVYANHEFGPMQWREYPSYANSVEETLKKIFAEYIESGWVVDLAG